MDTYDPNGNLTNNGIFVFVYDYKNRLMEVRNTNDSSLVVTYVYDVLGRRIEKKVGDVVTRYVYANQDILTEIRSIGEETFKKSYISGLGTDNLIVYDQEAIDPTNTGSIITNRYYFHKDHLGSIVGLTNESGDTVVEYAYDSFGKIYTKSGTGMYEEIGTTGNPYNNSRLFTGREYDAESGLYYYRARYYSPEMGRFLERDPIGTSDDVNLYGYVGNDPVNSTDPEGKEKVIIIIGQQKKLGESDAGGLYQYNEYIKRGFKPKNIIGKYATSIEEFNAIVHSYNNVASITFLSHGSPESLGSSGINPMIDANNVSELTPITNENGNMCVNTTVTLVACNTGVGANSIGQQMANELNSTVIAPNAYVDIGTSEGAGRAMGFPGMFDPNRKSGQPTFYNFDNAKIGFGLFGGRFNTFSPK